MTRRDPDRARPFRPLFHAATWPAFLCELTGVLTGHTALACVRAALLGATVSWQRGCDCFRRTRWSHTAVRPATTTLVLNASKPI